MQTRLKGQYNAQKSKIDPLASSVCQTADNCNNSKPGFHIIATIARIAAIAEKSVVRSLRSYGNIKLCDRCDRCNPCDPCVHDRRDRKISISAILATLAIVTFLYGNHSAILRPLRSLRFYMETTLRSLRSKMSQTAPIMHSIFSRKQAYSTFPCDRCDHMET